MSEPDQILEAVEREILARLTAEPCELCKRGKDADGVAATALAKISNDIRRLKIAREKANPEGSIEVASNPFALVPTIQKLPVNHPRREDLLGMLEGQIISLQEAVRGLRREDGDGFSGLGSEG